MIGVVLLSSQLKHDNCDDFVLGEKKTIFVISGAETIPNTENYWCPARRSMTPLGMSGGPYHVKIQFCYFIP